MTYVKSGLEGVAVLDQLMTPLFFANFCTAVSLNRNESIVDCICFPSQSFEP